MNQLDDALARFETLHLDVARRCVQDDLTAGDVANRLRRTAHAVGRQAFADALARCFLDEPGLRSLNITVSFADEYNDQGGTYRCASVYAEPVFDGRPRHELSGPGGGYDPADAEACSWNDVEAVDQWTEVLTEVMESEAYWLDDGDLDAMEFRVTRGMLEAAIQDGQLDLAAFWRALSTSDAQATAQAKATEFT